MLKVAPCGLTVAPICAEDEADDRLELIAERLTVVLAALTVVLLLAA